MNIFKKLFTWLKAFFVKQEVAALLESAIIDQTIDKISEKVEKVTDQGIAKARDEMKKKVRSIKSKTAKKK